MMFHNHELYSVIYNTFIYLASHLPTDTKDFPLSKPASPHMTSKLIIPETTSVLTSHQLFLSPLDFPYQHTKLLKYHFCLQRRKAFQFPPANNSFSTLPYSKIFRLVCCHYTSVTSGNHHVHYLQFLETLAFLVFAALTFLKRFSFSLTGSYYYYNCRLSNNFGESSSLASTLST